MAGIFVSYRRSDAGGHVGRLVAGLCARFPPSSVFQDLESILAGTEVVPTINGAIASSRVMLVVIGSDWQGAAHGHIRLHDDDDPVRHEIAWAFHYGLEVIPVLVGDGKMPEATQLPPNIRALAKFQPHAQSPRHWELDLDELAKLIARRTGLAFSRASVAPVVVPPRSSRGGWLAASLFVLAGAAFLALFPAFSDHSKDRAAASPLAIDQATLPAPAAPSLISDPTRAPLAAPAPTPTPTPWPAPAPPPAAAAALDVTGAWYSAADLFSPQFQQVGPAVSVRANMGTDQVVMVGQGAWATGQLNINFNLLTAPGDQHIAGGVMTLTPSPDQSHLLGTLQITGGDTTPLDLQRKTR